MKAPRHEPVAHIRRAKGTEGERLREIAYAAKAHWGYDPQKVRAWANAGDYSGSLFRAKEVYIAEAEGQIVAWASLVPQRDLCWLDDLWVEPDWIGAGIGRQLFYYAIQRARELGATWMKWEAEPNAIGFYEKMGGRVLGNSPPSAWGRVLQVMGVDVA